MNMSAPSGRTVALHLRTLISTVWATATRTSFTPRGCANQRTSRDYAFPPEKLSAVPVSRSAVPSSVVGLLLLVVLTGLLSSCGDGKADGVIDLAAQADPDLELPDFFPPEWGLPPRATLVDVQAEPDDPTIGPSATWIVDDNHEGVVEDTETILTSLRWTIIETQAEPGADAQRTYFLIDNGRAYSVTVFTTPQLEGTRLTLELPSETRRDAPK